VSEDTSPSIPAWNKNLDPPIAEDSAEQENPRCTICGNVKSRHAQMRHPFSHPDNPIGPSQIFGNTRAGRTGGSGKGPAMDKALVISEVKESALPFDPVLRQALVMKGVITYEDLEAAERHIRMVTGKFHGGVEDSVGL
jgi:hypothetical protein